MIKFLKSLFGPSETEKRELEEFKLAKREAWDRYIKAESYAEARRLLTYIISKGY